MMEKKEVTEWVSLEERLPPVAGFYLAVCDWMGVVEKVEFDGKDRWNFSFGKPTHWMLLPLPPGKTWEDVWNG